VRDCFDALRRQLENHVRRRRGNAKAHEVPSHGKVARLIAEGDYGLMMPATAAEVHFHRNAVANAGYEKLRVGEEIRFTAYPGEGEKGPPGEFRHPRRQTPLGTHTQRRAGFLIHVKVAADIGELARTASAMAADLPAQTAQWLEQFVVGISCAIRAIGMAPSEFGLLALGHEEWSHLTPDVFALQSATGTHHLSIFCSAQRHEE
jgi:cold shock CspA family protein